VTTKRKCCVALLGVMALAVGSCLLPRVWVEEAARGRTFDAVEEIPTHEVALVLGCARHLPDGRTNLFFQRRMAAAAALFQAGKARYLIVSGDNHRRGYDEPTDMKEELVRRGVPESRIYCDYAGFRTLDSVVRAKKIFGQTQIIIVSQEFHNQRAIYIARQNGMDVVGFNAAEVHGPGGLRTKLREELARVKTVLDVLAGTSPRFLGDPVRIGESVGAKSLTTAGISC